MITTIIGIIFLIVSLFYICYHIYLFQIKEYRIDRIIGAIHDKGFVQIFLLPTKLPAKTLKNSLVGGISLLLVLLLYFIVGENVVLSIILLFITPFMSFSVVSISVSLLNIPTNIKRRLIINKAVKKLKSVNPVVIGITGSYGKTTTKEYLYELLSTKFKVAKTDANLNTDVGVALSILKNVESDTQYFIAEMGAYKRGEIKTICDMVHPTHGIITGIGNQHIDLFGSQNNLIQAKRELLQALPKEGRAFVNAEHKFHTELKKRVQAPITFFSEFTDPSDMNSRTVLALAEYLGVQAKQNIPIPRAIHTGYLGSHIIDNSYSTNVEGFIYSIMFLDKQKVQNRIMVSRGIIELGDEKQSSYKRILHVLAKSSVLLYTTDADFLDGANSRVRYFKNETNLNSFIMNKLNRDAVILFEGRYDKKFINKLLL